VLIFVLASQLLTISFESSHLTAAPTVESNGRASLLSTNTNYSACSFSLLFALTDHTQNTHTHTQNTHTCSLQGLATSLQPRCLRMRPMLLYFSLLIIFQTRSIPRDIPPDPSVSRTIQFVSFPQHCMPDGSQSKVVN
jgi:hypothetical protein